jgi:histidine triad (HIT) family protein
MDCIFCRIVAGALPASKVCEDGETLAFMDINPLTEGHVLVIPKRHCVGLFDADEAALAACARTLRRVALAQKRVLGLDSLNLLQATGRWAFQSVDHLHFHLIPRHEGDGAGMDWEFTPGQPAALKALAARIAQAVR